MPLARLTHPRIGHSRKVCALTHLEFRVWDTYRWCADDFGVMPKSPAKLQGENEALEREPRAVIEAAIDRCLALELLCAFPDQTLLYVCSLTWQTHQQIRRPRSTFLPCPSVEVLQRMDDPTIDLFRSFHAKFPKDFRNVSASRARPRVALANAERDDLGTQDRSSDQRRTPIVREGGAGETTAPPFDQWFGALKREYPENRITSGYRTQTAFVDQFTRDPREAAEVWAEMCANLDNQKQGHEWRVKRMIPTLEKWLSEERWRQRHEEYPADALHPATRDTLAAADAILRGKA